MSEGDEVELARRRQAMEVVRLAIMSAGDIDADWNRRVMSYVPRVAALLRPSGRNPGALEAAAWVLDAAVFKATYDYYEFEETSQRVMVYVKADNAEDAEPLRTEPVYTDLGRMMATRVKYELTPGDEILVFKHMEQIDAKRKVRMLANFEILRRVPRPDGDAVERPAGPQHPPAAPASGAGGDSAPPPAPPSAATPAVDDVDGSPLTEPSTSPSPLDETLGPDPGPGSRPSGETAEDAQARRNAAVQAALKGLSNRQKIAVNATCRGLGIHGWESAATEDEIDAVLSVINKIARGEQ